ncbi:hypothetical protein CRUP_015180 [Coryphaenoides rupestris]|nr:hypothetical protein CRUP_015180 [Coryphaenoides rupestris]
MLRGGGLSQRWYISTTGLGTEERDTTCWSWMNFSASFLSSLEEEEEEEEEELFLRTAGE